MVFFVDHDGHLSIVSDAKRDPRSGLLLRVEEPLFGRHLPASEEFVPSSALAEWSSQPTRVCGKFSCLRSHLHSSKAGKSDFATLGSRILAESAIWGKSWDIRGEFSFIPKYWEWTEDVLSRLPSELAKADLTGAIYASLYIYDRKKDVMRAFCENWCPKTNTLHTSSGEASISLWDLHRLGGLPVSGFVYDEVIPSATELTGTADDRSFLPTNCKYLFATYRLLSRRNKENEGVSLSSWIEFWFRAHPRYKKPGVSKESTSSRSSPPFVPDGFTLSQQSWEGSVAKAYTELGVSHTSRKDIYLAAFLACWLCVFVLPGKSPVIRPGTFKIASLMSSGRVVNLAVPVLAKIYHGLNQIATSNMAGSSNACFPAHYLYGWISHYFEAYLPRPKGSPLPHGPWMTVFSGQGGAGCFGPDAARQLIHGKIKWGANLYPGNENKPIVDDLECSSTEQTFLLSVRSSYLAVRCDGEIIVEPYSPFRFARQFGFLQDIPGALRKCISTPTVKDLMELTSAFGYLNSKCKLIVPSHPKGIRDHVTSDYSEWWRSVHDIYYLTKGSEPLDASTRRTVLHRKKKPAKRHRPPGDAMEGTSAVGARANLQKQVVIPPPSPPKASLDDEVRTEELNEDDDEPYLKRMKLRTVISSESEPPEAPQDQGLQVPSLNLPADLPEISNFPSLPGTSVLNEWVNTYIVHNCQKKIFE